jgi:hypothetical protein
MALDADASAWGLGGSSGLVGNVVAMQRNGIRVGGRGGRLQCRLLDPATLRRRASLRTGQYVNVLAFAARGSPLDLALQARLRRFRNRSRDFYRRRSRQEWFSGGTDARGWGAIVDPGASWEVVFHAHAEKAAGDRRKAGVGSSVLDGTQQSRAHFVRDSG